jgi:acetyltransferase-like isoleucine patch superfamily enzyme
MDEKSGRRIPQTSVTGMPGSALEKYMARAVGSHSYLDLLAYEIVNALFRNFPGALGLFLRRFAYGKLFGAFGKKSVAFEGVAFRCPKRLFIGAGTVIDQGVLFDIKSENAGVHVGERCQLMRGVTFEAGYDGSVRLGDEVYVGPYTILNGQGGLEIGQKTLIGGHCYFVAGNHVFEDPNIPIREQGFVSKGIVVEEDVWIGGGATVLDGVRVGKGAVVSAGAVVARSVEPFAIVAGVPARRIKSRNPETGP